MPALVVAVVLLAMVCALHTALLVAVVRRLRLQADLLVEVEEAGVPARALRVGAVVHPFTVSDTDGEPVSDTTWAAPTLVAFFSPTCGSCRRLRRDFGRVAARWPGNRPAVVSVVTGRQATAEYAAGLSAVTRVVVDADETVRQAFEVRSFPAIFVVAASGELLWTGRHVHAVPDLPAPAGTAR